MSDFQFYFLEGINHILDRNAYDHMCYVIVLCAIYAVYDWKRILALITAFTIGHSITLALATFRIITIKTELVEFLIPLTILVTAITNLFVNENKVYSSKGVIQPNFWVAIFVGLIHGMGFSNQLRAMLFKEQSIFSPLLSFNLGLEVGQIIIVVVFLSISFILVDLVGVSRRDWRFIVSSAIGGIALILMKDAVYW